MGQIEAVSRDGLALAHAHEALRADREVALIAIQRTGRALQHTSLTDDRELVHPGLGSKTPAW